jgi:cyclopropane-fatty-acyl-phospholipid synthase
MTAHYVRTLQHWRQRFHPKLDEVRALGYSEAFIRMWNYYLCYCEAAFAERQIQTVQLMFAKADWTGRGSSGAARTGIRRDQPLAAGSVQSAD